MILLAIIAGIFWYVIWSVGSLPVSKGQINIKPGSTFMDLRESLILDVADWRLRLYKKVFAPDFDLKSGTFPFSGATTLRDALAGPLVKPLYNDQTITILPGWSIYDIDPYLVSQGIMKSGELIQSVPASYPKLQKKYPFLGSVKSFEGFLYPDTYRIRQ